MIIEEYIIIGVGSRNIKHLKELGYDAKYGVDILILSTHLPKTSNTIIHAKCDSCDEETELKKTNYTKSLKYHNYYCCQKCAIDKITKTNLEKYGVENVFQNEKIKDKIKETNLEKYGVENPQQNLKILDKQQKSALKRKKYKNTDLYYQGGYEKNFLDIFYNKNIKNGPTIKYFFDDKNKVYFSDFYYEPKKLIIEIKSDYYYNLHLEQNLVKQKTCIEQGYNFLFIIDRKYDEFEKLIN